MHVFLVGSLYIYAFFTENLFDLLQYMTMDKLPS